MTDVVLIAGGHCEIQTEAILSTMTRRRGTRRDGIKRDGIKREETRRARKTREEKVHIQNEMKM